MNNIFTYIKSIKDKWFSETIGNPNGNPVSIRVMNNVSAQFHTHEYADEMFIVISGTLYIDTQEGIEILNEGQAYTVKAGVRHRARVESRAELIVIGGRIDG